MCCLTQSSQLCPPGKASAASLDLDVRRPGWDPGVQSQQLRGLCCLCSTLLPLHMQCLCWRPWGHAAILVYACHAAATWKFEEAQLLMHNSVFMWHYKSGSHGPLTSTFIGFKTWILQKAESSIYLLASCPRPWPFQSRGKVTYKEEKKKRLSLILGLQGSRS